MAKTEWYAAAMLLAATTGALLALIAAVARGLSALGFWRAVSVRWYRRREYYPAWLKAWQERRAREARLREVEAAAPGLFAFLRQELAENPQGRLLRVTWGSCCQIHHTKPDLEYADDGPGGDLGRWRGHHGDELFRRVHAMDSPPVYEISEDLVGYLGRG